MEITALNGEFIKICKNSITVKDENDKTRGVIRNVTNFRDLQPNKQFDYVKIINEFRKIGVSITKFYIKDSRVYFLYNLKTVDFYKKYGKTVTEEEYNQYLEREKIVDLIRQAEKITVIECRYNEY